MAITLDQFMRLAGNNGIDESRALELHADLARRVPALFVADDSHSGRGQPQPLFVAIYCQLVSLARVSQVLLAEAGLRTRPRGVYRAGEEIALWGPAASLSARICVSADPGTGCELAISPRHGHPAMSMQTGILAGGGECP
jgi:hypothetical protein